MKNNNLNDHFLHLSSFSLRASPPCVQSSGLYSSCPSCCSYRCCCCCCWTQNLRHRCVRLGIKELRCPLWLLLPGHWRGHLSHWSLKTTVHTADAPLHGSMFVCVYQRAKLLYLPYNMLFKSKCERLLFLFSRNQLLMFLNFVLLCNIFYGKL